MVLKKFRHSVLLLAQYLALTLIASVFAYQPAFAKEGLSWDLELFVGSQSKSGIDNTQFNNDIISSSTFEESYLLNLPILAPFTPGDACRFGGCPEGGSFAPQRQVFLGGKPDALKEQPFKSSKGIRFGMTWNSDDFYDVSLNFSYEQLNGNRIDYERTGGVELEVLHSQSIRGFFGGGPFNPAITLTRLVDMSILYEGQQKLSAQYNNADIYTFGIGLEHDFKPDTSFIQPYIRVEGSTSHIPKLNVEIDYTGPSPNNAGAIGRAFGTSGFQGNRYVIDARGIDDLEQLQVLRNTQISNSDIHLGVGIAGGLSFRLSDSARIGTEISYQIRSVDLIGRGAIESGDQYELNQIRTSVRLQKTF